MSDVLTDVLMMELEWGVTVRDEVFWTAGSFRGVVADAIDDFGGAGAGEGAGAGVLALVDRGASLFNTSALGCAALAWV